MHYIQNLANKMQKKKPKKSNWQEAGRRKEQSSPWKILCVSSCLSFYYLRDRGKKVSRTIHQWLKQKRSINVTEKYSMDPEFHTSQNYSLIVRKKWNKSYTVVVGDLH